MNRKADIKTAFAVKVFKRKEGLGAIVYRWQASDQGEDHLTPVASLTPIAYQAALSLLREAVRESADEGDKATVSLTPGQYLQVDSTWGPRLATAALVCTGLRDIERMAVACGHLRHMNGGIAAWWLGRLLWRDNGRALRALRILVEAVQ